MWWWLKTYIRPKESQKRDVCFPDWPNPLPVGDVEKHPGAGVFKKDDPWMQDEEIEENSDPITAEDANVSEKDLVAVLSHVRRYKRKGRHDYCGECPTCLYKDLRYMWFRAKREERV